MLGTIINTSRKKYVFNTDSVSFKGYFSHIFDPEKDGRRGSIQVQDITCNDFKALYIKKFKTTLKRKNDRYIAVAHGKIKKRGSLTMLTVSYSLRRFAAIEPFIYLIISILLLIKAQEKPIFIGFAIVLILQSAWSYYKGYRLRKRLIGEFEKALQDLVILCKLDSEKVAAEE